MKKLTELPVFHRGSLANVIDDYHTRYRGGDYTANMVRVSNMLEQLGVPSEQQLSYGLHVPMVMNKAKRLLLERIADLLILKNQDVQWRTLYGNFFRLGGVEIDDVKINDKDVEPDHNSEFLSTLDTSFASGKVGEFIRSQFTEPCRYEK